MARPQVHHSRLRVITSVLVLFLWLIALLCIPLHAGASMADDHGHTDCASACCAHPGMIADVPAAPPAPIFVAPEPFLEHQCATSREPAQMPPTGPDPLSRGRPPDLQVFLT